ncbi:YdeI/OmpD-associated family protein [Paenibacillus sp. GCM10027626]|uniref:YdeI/OmpD-associated family protein n=1 Tax=Paenibacillus sp. GCM10027626 TaxID=3273411 RepID=UPI00363211E0
MTKSIVEKLNLQKYDQKAVLNQPAGSDYFAALPVYDTNLQADAYDLIFAFVLDSEALKQLTDQVIAEKRLNKNGYLFAAYPKKGNKVYPTYIHRDELFGILGSDEEGYIGNSSVKFARMVGLDDVFTVVGFKEDAAGKAKAEKAAVSSSASSKPSQQVDDYIDLIPDIERDLAGDPTLLSFYQSLTQGYRKDWARYVYSVKQEETRAKRREEMKMILQAGYKSRELYRKDHR